MHFTIKAEVRYVPLPPEKEYAYKAALLWLYEILVEVIEEINEDERKAKKVMEIQKNGRHNR